MRTVDDIRRRQLDLEELATQGIDTPTRLARTQIATMLECTVDICERLDRVLKLEEFFADLDKRVAELERSEDDRETLELEASEHE